MLTTTLRAAVSPLFSLALPDAALAAEAAVFGSVSVFILVPVYILLLNNPFPAWYSALPHPQVCDSSF